MKGNMNIIVWTLVLSMIIALAHGAPTEVSSDNNAIPSLTANQDQAQSSVITRADDPANAGASGGVPVSKPTATVGTFFDNIFNIPTSVLRAVNQFLNNNIKIGQSQSSKTAGAAASPQSVGTTTAANTEVQTDASTSGTPSTSTAATPSGAPANKPTARGTFFDNIFNIPISAINSVNSLLTGRRPEDNGRKNLQ